MQGSQTETTHPLFSEKISIFTTTGLPCATRKLRQPHGEERRYGYLDQRLTLLTHSNIGNANLWREGLGLGNMPAFRSHSICGRAKGASTIQGEESLYKEWQGLPTCSLLDNARELIPTPNWTLNKCTGRKQANRLRRFAHLSHHSRTNPCKLVGSLYTCDTQTHTRGFFWRTSSKSDKKGLAKDKKDAQNARLGCKQANQSGHPCPSRTRTRFTTMDITMPKAPPSRVRKA